MTHNDNFIVEKFEMIFNLNIKKELKIPDSNTIWSYHINFLK